MGYGNPQQALEALHRLLADGAVGGQAKIDALVALSQRSVHVAVWAHDTSSFRTLVNSSGASALPVFTELAQLEKAGTHFGWHTPDGKVPEREVGAREALRYALVQNLNFVVVDIAASHALEIDKVEIEPLLTPTANRESRGPFAAVGKVSSSMMPMVKPTPRPGSVVAPDLNKVLSTQGLQASFSSAPPAPAAPPVSESKTDSRRRTGFSDNPIGGNVVLVPLSQIPSDDALEAISDVLRSYPEVEWASFCWATWGGLQPTPVIGIRMVDSFRNRIQEIVGVVRAAGYRAGIPLHVLMLDDPQLTRVARSTGLVFYPWRRPGSKSTG